MAPKRKKTYSEEDLICALAEIRNGSSYRKTSIKYGIPVMTLHDKAHDKVSVYKYLNIFSLSN